MISREIWADVKNRWPDRYWDEHFRSPSITKGRSCIYPEVPRVENFGRNGVSQGSYYVNYVYPIRRNTMKVNYENVNIDTLTKDNYESSFFGLFETATPVTIATYKKISSFQNNSNYKIEFSSRNKYQKLCVHFGITYSTRYHIPRTSYHKITLLNLGTHKVFLYPSSDSIQLD
ncbi:Alpha-1,3-mannosyl-glycoprotein 2-beta-N-acetylglucosaminyltransferase [Thelohanellus kitauei]|uniref:Alpha-1,3-mannosyl-glycoprotein 2-beta-N-acetylglucosaminyltransferase n=1 Tax=Thelohanellus kitauei TaxID=669202 RepID=A0A0C2MR07_THEKT|nr:Alpha-1,3-mannosyl-glycoprotein 2-beta-N-acetylglucosaminyltransferase [Thelohanellus kitauei]